MLFSQKQHFLYIQSEPVQPFVVRLGNELRHSSASGYLILSRLQDSSYSLTVSFPQNKWPAQVFRVAVSGADQGFALRNNPDRGWGLYNYAGSGVIAGMPVAAADPVAGKMETNDASAFATLLARVANDPSLMEKPVAREEKEKAAPTTAKKEESATPREEKSVLAEAPAKKPETSPVTDTPAENKTKQVSADTGNDQQAVTSVPEKKEAAVVKPDSIASRPRETASVKPPDQSREVVPEARKEESKERPAAERLKPSVVTRQSEENHSGGTIVVFVDEYPGGRKDTVRILIPGQQAASQSEGKDSARLEHRFLDLPASDSVRANPDSAVFALRTPSCTAVADEDDFLKLRKKMAAARGDDGMITEARKVFRTRCFSTQQLRNLGALFLNEEGRYRFFDAAYPHVSDPQQFSSLAAELNDPYFLNRFKAMLR